MRKTTTAKTANVGRIPPKLVTIPPTKAHTKRTATYATKPTVSVNQVVMLEGYSYDSYVVYEVSRIQ